MAAPRKSTVKLGWPALRQLATGDLLGRGPAVTSARTEEITPRIETADRVVKSVCPFCAVGCAQKIYVKDEKIIQIEGDPDAPHSRGRLCPKGAATEQLVNSATRVTTVKYRAPYSREWVDLDHETAMEMIVDRFLESRDKFWEEEDDKGNKNLHRTMGIAALGGAALDNEENYLIKKLFTAAGAIQIENQARI